MITRRSLLAGAVFALAAAPRLSRAQGGDAAAPIAALNAGLLAAMRAGDKPFAQRAASLGPVVDAAFDLHAILQAAVGPRWSGLPAAQQAALFEAFHDYTVASWVANFDKFEGQRFEIDPTPRQVGADQVVQSRIVPADGAPTRLDYVMRAQPDGWKAVDVLVDGTISRVAVQRSDFRTLLKDGDAGALIAMLRGKAASLAGGAKS